MILYISLEEVLCRSKTNTERVYLIYNNNNNNNKAIDIYYY